jgi:hypothetical protein
MKQPYLIKGGLNNSAKLLMPNFFSGNPLDNGLKEWEHLAPFSK